MPTYDYKCKECDYTWEEQQRVAARNVPRYNPCPECKSSGDIVMLFGTPAFSDPVKLGIRKPDKDVVERINTIKKDYGSRAGDSLKNFRWG